jgi:hypothetical protein
MQSSVSQTRVVKPQVQRVCERRSRKRGADVPGVTLGPLWLLPLGLALLTSAGFPGRLSKASPSNDLYNLFGLDIPPADVVVMLDASKSMVNHQYREVRQAVLDFVPTLTQNETLHLRIFGNVVSSPLEGSGPELATSVAGGTCP